MVTGVKREYADVDNNDEESNPTKKVYFSPWIIATPCWNLFVCNVSMRVCKLHLLIMYF